MFALLLAVALAACGPEPDPVGPMPFAPEFALVEYDGAPLPQFLGATAEGDSLFLEQERLALDFAGGATLRRTLRHVRASGIDTSMVQTWDLRYTVRGDSVQFSSTLICIRAPCGPQLRGRRTGTELAMLLQVERGWDLVEVPLRYRAVGASVLAPD